MTPHESSAFKAMCLTFTRNGGVFLPHHYARFCTDHPFVNPKAIKRLMSEVEAKYANRVSPDAFDGEMQG